MKIVRFSFCLVLFISYTAIAVKEKEIPVADQALMLIKTVEKYHYSPRAVNDSFSEIVYSSFLRMLDPFGTLFTEESNACLEPFKFSLSNQILSKKTDFLDAATRVYEMQIRAADSLVRGFSKKEMDLFANDTLHIEEKAHFVKQKSLSKKWEQWIKYTILWSYRNKGDSILSAIRPTPSETKRILGDVITRETCRISAKLNPLGGIRAFTGLCYLKALSNAFDPHTEYMSLSEKNQFESDLSKESGLFGLRFNFNVIGEIEISGIMPASPAWLSNKINEGDVVLDIKKSDGSRIDMRCINESDIDKFLFSTDDKPVDFRIRKKNGKILTVTLRKEMVDVEDNTIRSFILKGNTSIGYIYLPSFYTDFSYNSYLSAGCANDVAKELIKLKGARIDGLIFDVRSNGGGAMEEAVRLAGSFVDYGALCIVHERGKQPVVLKDNAKGTVYDGPLVILTNSSSASAAELFAGVLQDYNRAIIVGNPTFGKGTMQQILPIDAGNFDSLSLYKGNPPGYLRLTHGSFYRVTGASNQRTGIIPDIALPQYPENSIDRECAYDGALELSPISKKAYYYPLEPIPKAPLKAQSEERVRNNAGFKLIKKNQIVAGKTNSELNIPLSFQLFVNYMKRFDASEDSLTAKNCPFSVQPLDFGNTGKTMVKKNAADEIVMKNIKADLYINESYAVVNDLINAKGKREEK